MNSLISFIVVLGVLIVVHELGHFLFAKLFGVRVLKFSPGFGNKVISRKWGETERLLLLSCYFTISHIAPVKPEA